MSGFRHVSALSFAMATLLSAAGLRADPAPLDVVDRTSHRIRVDGILPDWSRFTGLYDVATQDQVMSGAADWSGQDDSTFRYALARDDQSLYVAVEVADDRVVRSADHRANEDAVVLTLATPSGNNRFNTVEIVLMPGDPGSFGAVARLRNGRRETAIGNAQVVESASPSRSGFFIEAAIPWSALGDIRSGLASLRGRVAYYDYDGGASATVLASGPGDAQHPADLPGSAGAAAGSGIDQLLGAFVRSQSLGNVTPWFDRTMNIAGDAALERVVVFPNQIFVAGPGVGGGTQYFAAQHEAQRREDFVDASARDVTGDGVDELVVRLKTHGDRGITREVLSVYGVVGGGWGRIFAQEMTRQQGNSRLTNAIAWDRGRMRISVDRAEGFTSANYPQFDTAGITAPLMPWSGPRTAVWRWNDSSARFEVEGASTDTQTQTTTNNTTATVEPTPPPAVDMEAVLALFRRRAGLPENTRATQTLSGDVAGDSTRESVFIIGKSIVIAGPGFQGGRSYASMDLPVDAPGDIGTVQLGDVTDDGHSEVFVRVKRKQAFTGAQGARGELVMEMLLVYSFDETHRGRIFAAEISRKLGNDSVSSTVGPLRTSRNAELVIEAGRGTGAWTSESAYPFDGGGIDGVESLILPWSNPSRVVYRWNGSALTASGH